MRLEKILGSKAKIKILKSLSGKKEMQLSEMSEYTGMSLSTIHEAIKDLVELRVLSVRKIGKTRLYRINESNYFARVANKTITAELEFYKKLLKDYVFHIKSSNTSNITLFGSFARGKELPTDIDILVVCKKSKSKIKDKVVETEGKLLEKYDIHFSTIVLSEDELKRKAKKNDRFIINIIAEGRKLFGKDLEVLAYGKRS